MGVDARSTGGTDGTDDADDADDADGTDGTDDGRATPGSPHYGGDHHTFSLIDQLGDRVEHGLEAPIRPADPGFIERALPVLDAALRYFDPTVEGFQHVPTEGPFLMVGNHSGGIYMPDFWAFLRHWYHERGTAQPIYSLGFDFLYSIPGWGELARRFGSVPASHRNADRLLASGAPLMVYPGGDEEDYRPWTERNRVELRGRTGFIRLALRNQVPVVPFVAHGSHDAIIVLTRGEHLARRLGFDRLRINVMPVVAGLPWGIAPVQLPTWPLPSKVTLRVCEPVDWSRFGPEAADDPEIVRRCYDEIVELMQANLDELAASLPHPVAARLWSASGLDRLTRR